MFDLYEPDPSFHSLALSIEVLPGQKAEDFNKESWIS